MSAGFVRRYGAFPSAAVLGQIEGVVIVDLPPPGSIAGIGTGVVAIVGEFPDMTYATSVSSSGVVSTQYQPQEIFSAQDLVDKLGGFDELLGAFGTEGGNGFAWLRNKSFSRLVAVPVNLCSSAGVRLWRDLPTNKSATDPTPIVPMAAAIVSAGRQFYNAANRARVAAKVAFTDAAPLSQAADGVQVTNTGPAATAHFTSATGAFVTAGVAKGDILVLGVIGGAGVPGTYRITVVNSASDVTVERLDGASFTWADVVTLPFRIHPRATADSGPAALFSEAAGYVIPARALDASITSSLLLTPSTLPAAGTATTWDTLSGLGGAVMPTTGLVYDATTQAPNVTGTGLDAAYQAALAALMVDQSPQRDVNIVACARQDTVIRAAMKSHVLSASAVGYGRIALLAPSLATVQLGDALKDTTPGVGLYRDERLVYTWPGIRQSIPEAVGLSIKLASGGYGTDGILDQTADASLASVLSNLATERNPGQAADPVPRCLAHILGFQTGALSNLSMAEYIALRQKGVCALRIDTNSGPIFQSGVTTSLTSGQKNINRRRFADEAEDSIAQRYLQFSKLPLTQDLKDTILGETIAYCEGLKSPNNPAASRITDYSVDGISGNTPALTAAGIYVVIVSIKMTPTADVIVLQAECGSEVQITQLP